jgi:predicted metal-dependent phosphotriesterase family hydrolase
MGKVRTILGDVDSGDLGIVDSHEHLIRTGGLEVTKGGEDFRLDNVEKAINEVKPFIKAGGKTIVDMNPASAGRDINKLLEIARAVPEVHLLTCTGFHEGRVYDNVIHWTATYEINQIADLLIADIEEGVDIFDYTGPIVERSKAKAGCIKIGTAYGLITPVEERIIKAAAIAQKETGVCINTHTSGGTMAYEQVERLVSYGVKPEKIVVGHVQRNPDIWYHKKIAAMGANFMYDGSYRIKYLPDSSRVMLIREMVKAGYQKHICLGTDAGRRTYQKSWGSGTGIDYDETVFLPRLREEGISEDVIKDIYINNPARYFSIDK